MLLQECAQLVLALFESLMLLILHLYRKHVKFSRYLGTVLDPGTPHHFDGGVFNTVRQLQIKIILILLIPMSGDIDVNGIIKNIMVTMST